MAAAIAIAPRLDRIARSRVGPMSRDRCAVTIPCDEKCLCSRRAVVIDLDSGPIGWATLEEMGRVPISLTGLVDVEAMAHTRAVAMGSNGVAVVIAEPASEHRVALPAIVDSRDCVTRSIVVPLTMNGIAPA
jgi:hypothetical protein